MNEKNSAGENLPLPAGRPLADGLADTKFLSKKIDSEFIKKNSWKNIKY